MGRNGKLGSGVGVNGSRQPDMQWQPRGSCSGEPAYARPPGAFKLRTEPRVVMHRFDLIRHTLLLQPPAGSASPVRSNVLKTATIPFQSVCCSGEASTAGIQEVVRLRGLVAADPRRGPRCRPEAWPQAARTAQSRTREGVMPHAFGNSTLELSPMEKNIPHREGGLHPNWPTETNMTGDPRPPLPFRSLALSHSTLARQFQPTTSHADSPAPHLENWPFRNSEKSEKKEKAAVNKMRTKRRREGPIGRLVSVLTCSPSLLKGSPGLFSRDWRPDERIYQGRGPWICMSLLLMVPTHGLP